MRLSFISLAILFIVLGHSFAGAAWDFRNYQKNRWELSAEASYFAPSGNYLRSGNSFDSMPAGYSYQLINMDFGARWSVLPKWAVSAQVRAGIAQSKDPLLTRNNSQFNQLVLGTDFLLLDGSFKLIPDLSTVVPLARADKTSDSVQTGEGATEFTGQMRMQFRLSKLQNELKIGFNYRDEGRAALALYGAKTQLDFSGWALGGGVEGYMTAIQDNSTGNPSDRETNPLRVNGRSTIFNMVNPSSIEAQLFYKFLGRNWEFDLGIANSITGTNSAVGQRFWTGLVYRFQTESRSSSAPKTEAERFREETNDGVDQILFQPEPTPAPRKTRPAVDRRKNIQNDLNNTEMTIELKAKKTSKKKKKKAYDE